MAQKQSLTRVMTERSLRHDLNVMTECQRNGSRLCTYQLSPYVIGQAYPISDTT